MRNSLSPTSVVLLSVVLLSVYVVLPCAAEPQDSQKQQGQSVADAARRSREQKKNAARQARVIRNEDWGTEYFKAGQEGLNFGAPASQKSKALSASTVAAAEAAEQAETSANKGSRPKGKDAEEAAAEDAKIAKLREQIAEAEEHLKWQQRELALDQDTVYSNPNYTDSRTGKAKLDSEQQRINERRQEIEGLKANLAVLQERQKQGAPPESSAPGPITTNVDRRQFLLERGRCR
jgi:hypothetical protein